MIQINDLCMSAGNFSIKNINLSVPEGCCHVLLGGTGNGKTLILKTIAGLKPIASGEIWSDERNITKQPPENRFISYVPQDLALFPHLNVEKNILYSQRFKKNQGRTNQEISEIIKSLQLEGLMHRAILNLSGGEQQRVALARAFASGNKVLLLDEPFSALHYTLKRTLWSLLSNMQKSYNMAILMVTHDLEEAFFLADYISVLHQGSILQTGTKEEILNNPNSIEVTKITGHYNYFSGKVVNVTDNQFVINIDKLNLKAFLNNSRLVTGDTVDVAVRTSSIKIIPSGSKVENALICTVKNTYDSLNYQQIVVTPDIDTKSTQEEIVIDNYGGRQDAIKQGQSVTICFPPEDTLLYKN